MVLKARSRKQRRAKNKRYYVTLTPEEREQLRAMIPAGKAAARKLAHARILLKADEADEGGPGWADEQIAEALDVGLSTVVHPSDQGRSRRPTRPVAGAAAVRGGRHRGGGCAQAHHAGVRPEAGRDETGKQLIGEIRSPLPPQPGVPARYDSGYVRNGTANLFIAFEPLAGWRHVEVTDSRRRTDWAWFVKDLVDGRYKEAEKVVLVMDQLNTHSIGSLYETFPAECLDRRMEDKPTLVQAVAAWESNRNQRHCRVDWQFTAADARVKLKRLYPSVQT